MAVLVFSAGMELVCDLCGVTDRLPLAETSAEALYRGAGAGWTTTGPQDLCPSCREQGERHRAGLAAGGGL